MIEDDDETRQWRQRMREADEEHGNGFVKGMLIAGGLSAIIWGLGIWAGFHAWIGYWP